MPGQLRLERPGSTCTLSGPVARLVLGALAEGGALNPEGAAPDLSRWLPRVTRRTGLASRPPEGSPDRARYDEAWLRLTRQDRGGEPPNGRQIYAWKLHAPGVWELSGSEVATLGRWLDRVPEAEALRAWLAGGDQEVRVWVGVWELG